MAEQHPYADAARPIQQTIQDMMGKPFHTPPPSQEAPWGSWVWEDHPHPDEAESLDDNGEPKAPAPDQPGDEVQGVPAEEGADEEGDADLVSVEAEGSEAIAADEVYAASFQSEDDQPDD